MNFKILSIIFSLFIYMHSEMYTIAEDGIIPKTDTTCDDDIDCSDFSKYSFNDTYKEFNQTIYDNGAESNKYSLGFFAITFGILLVL